MSPGVLLFIVVPAVIAMAVIISTVIENQRDTMRQALQRYHDNGRSRHELALAHIAQMECETGLCEHMVNGQHPRLYTTSAGEQVWILGPEIWKVGEPCPIKTDG